MNKPEFEVVYDAHYNDVWKFLLHASADVQTALDLTSQTFLRAYRAWPRFKEKAPVKAWLLSIAVNEWRRELRRRKIARVIPFMGSGDNQEAGIELVESEVEGVAEEIERNEAYKTLQQAIERLPEKYSTPIMLRYFEYLSIEEVADILKRPAGTVKSLVHRGIAKLREDQGLREACGETVIDISQLSVEKQ
jgi:RNA polymerase sigma-70 factor (ECF subfamily)